MTKQRSVWIAALVVLLAASTNSYGQGEKTTHVFPQVVDGLNPDGSGYTSILYVTNAWEAEASCTVTLFGNLAADRFLGGASMNVPGGSWALNITRMNAPLASGYLRLTCSREVFASMSYGLIDRNKRAMSWATVFSLNSTTYAHLPAILGFGFRYAIAIANDSATTASYNLSLYTNGEFSGKTVLVPARGRWVGFLDELLAVPSTVSLGTIEITSPTGLGFNAIGLIFDGSTFTTLVPSQP